jgi:hypothetical protein
LSHSFPVHISKIWFSGLHLAVSGNWFHGAQSFSISHQSLSYSWIY